METEFVAKRPHKKSRAGCQVCKVKKIKCDETRPTCTFCLNRNLRCVYIPIPLKSQIPATASNLPLGSTKLLHTSIPSDNGPELPMPPQHFSALSAVTLTPSGDLNDVDLRLLCHYSNVTWKSLAIRSDPIFDAVIQARIPQLALEKEFLMNAVLGITSAHMEHLLPDASQTRRQTDVYFAKSIKEYRKAVLQISPSNQEAIIVTGLMLIAFTSQRYSPKQDEELGIINLLKMYGGLYALIKVCWAGLNEGTILPIVQQELSVLSTLPIIPTLLFDTLGAVDVLDPASHHISIYLQALGHLGTLYASLKEDGVGANLSVRVVSWPILLSAQFVLLAKQRSPLSLVIMAHYLCFIKLINSLWWMDSLVSQDIQAIAHIVGPTCAAVLDLPLGVSRTRNVEGIADLMLSQSFCYL